MEHAYAEALMKLIEGGMQPKKAVRSLAESLQRAGRLALLPKICRAFARLTERTAAKQTVTLSVAREKDIRKALTQAKDALKQLGTKSGDVVSRVDDTLIGGWRLEGRERLVDTSWKKDLLSIYNRSTT